MSQWGSTEDVGHGLAGKMHLVLLGEDDEMKEDRKDRGLVDIVSYRAESTD